MRLFAILGIAALAGCTDKPYDPNAPAIDPTAPRVHITTPERGTIAGDVHTVTVTGTATDDTAVASVTVNDVPATLAADGTWTATVPVKAGTNLLHAIAKDAQGNAGKESRAVVAGPMVALAQDVPQAITATLSAQTFNAIGKGTAGFLTSGDLAPMLGTAPVMDLGNGPDCLYAKAWITSVTFGDADVTLAPQDGGLWLDVELDQANIGMHLEYAAACVDGSRDITIGASHISVSGNMTVGVAGHDFDIHLDNPNVNITGFNVELGGIPGAIVDMLSLDTAMGPILGWATERFVVPMLNNALAGLNNTKTMDVLGTMVDIDVKPDDIRFSSEGAVVILDTSLRAHGDAGDFVFTDNTVPAMDLSHGFQMAVADDAANQLFTSLWSAKALDKSIDLQNGSYGDIGKLYDSVQISAAVPPFVDASGDGLVLTVGDLVATFRNSDEVVTEVAINAQVDLQVVKGQDGALRFDVGTPTTYVDVLDENVEGANQLSNAQFEAITSFALSRVIAVGSGSVGAIPLPSVGGVSVNNLTIAEQTGYLVVDGEVQ
jgi:hypothetical protein